MYVGHKYLQWVTIIIRSRGKCFSFPFPWDDLTVAGDIPRPKLLLEAADEF